MSEKPNTIWVEFTWNTPQSCWYLEDWQGVQPCTDLRSADDYTCYLRKDGLPREMAKCLQRIWKDWDGEPEDMAEVQALLSRWTELGKEGGA